MTVAELQRILRSLADAIAFGKGTAGKELSEAASHLEPFAKFQVGELTEFLKVAQHYRETGELPESLKKPARKPATPKAPAKSADELLQTVRSLHDRALEPDVTRERVEAEVRAFEKLTASDLQRVAAELNYQKPPRAKKELLSLLVNYVMGRKAPVVRAPA